MPGVRLRLGGAKVAVHNEPSIANTGATLGNVVERIDRCRTSAVVQFEIWLLAPISMNPVPRFIWQPSVVGLPELRHENAVTRFQIRLQLIE